MSNQKTIVFFSGYYLPFLGGIERYTDKLTEELTKMGYRIIMVTSKHDESLADREEMLDGRVIYRLPVKKLFKQRYPILDINATYRQLMTALSEEEIDYVICNTRFHLTTLAGLRFAKKSGIPSLVIEHGSSHFTVNNRFLDFFGAIYEHVLTAYVKQLTKYFYAVSERSTQWLMHFGIEAEGVIYNSVSADLALNFSESYLLDKSEDEIFVTYAGRLLKEKGIEVLLEAFELNQFPDTVKLNIAGDGPLFEELIAQYESDRIRFLGKCDFKDTMSLMAQTDIFVYPSMYPEGLPTSILEAGMLSSAIIATDRGGTIEVINCDDLGVIIEENVQSLAEALKDLVTDETKRLALQVNIHKRILENFTWTQTAKHVESILKGMR
ncbi:TPA: glycosyltransferase family 4 protein [Streptococcus suis]|uniref:Glycosyltransferase family 4 protein n=2 Tax=Streptococcus TaxID=1301 RepID=A0A4T2GPU9_STRSU|nr:glycosyltransferase family 4 protein [Streptococcus sp. 29896]MBL6538319.1 glycosyltransferase family 4 protein [Streptococcus suis]MBM7269237.1 glycosyltransferase family 4 protein [Streptococcus suis]MCK4028065.1 glycosyltransferase family 4 protein [Streptococcus suis]TII01266.1 glycosyltransferase family 4 protein [Streptococcus suis]WNY46315.1 glycosyltransferase family 4 protein [Streptococcus sp. 29896]